MSDHVENEDPNGGDIRRALRTIATGVATLVDGQKLIAQVASTEGRMLAGLDGVKEQIGAVLKSLQGDGDGKTGLLSRVTRLEEAQASKTAIVVACISAGASIIAALAAVLLALYVRGGGH